MSHLEDTIDALDRLETQEAELRASVATQYESLFTECRAAKVAMEGGDQCDLFPAVIEDLIAEHGFSRELAESIVSRVGGVAVLATNLVDMECCRQQLSEHIALGEPAES